jgi:peptidoglycan/xylan/chitin deacetylase (PgdA/CDA1 family)
MVALLHRKYHFPFARQKNVVFTLDDGYADNFINAYPIFKKYNIPFCIYVCKKYVTGEEQAGVGENYEMLSVPQLKALVADPLCTIGCHTLSHPQLSKLPYQEQEQEIMEAKQWLETTLGTATHHFAYPYGDYNTDTISIVRSAGFKSAVSVRKLKTRGNEGELYLYQIPRITIHPKK